MQLLKNTLLLMNTLEKLSLEYAQCAEKETYLPDKRKLIALSDKFKVWSSNEFLTVDSNLLNSATYFENKFKNKKS